MRGFLGELAADLYGRLGRKVSELTVLFPSRRARLFFTDALSEIADAPLWQPRWATIDELMSEISGLQSGDRIRLITELYKIYKEFHPEPFDRFYAWGDLLLNDFDTIDKYLIDADRLFRNISDLKELEADLSYLTPSQLGILRSFWASLLGEEDLSKEKRRFLAVWRTLGDVYHRFKARLSELGIAYAGMIQRAAAERIAAGEYALPDPQRHYVVAGFNALSECEKRLFKFLATTSRTDFYWDYDTYYTADRQQEAGLFVRENLRSFPPRTELSHDHMSCPKRIEAIAASSDAVQCKYAARILRELVARNGGRPLGKETAVVLTDENLLMPLLYALPPEAGEVNVTMGYPLRQSLAYTFVERLLELQRHSRTKSGRTHFYHADVTGLLAHPYVAESDPETVAILQTEIVENRRIMVAAETLGCNDLLRLVFTAAEGWRGMSHYLAEVLSAAARLPYAGDETRRRVEFLAVIAEHIAKIGNSLEACELEIPDEVYVSLVRRTLGQLRIPFEGEPLEGLQVMGILETRNLDFENVLILSMNDDNFPGNLVAQSSFIPYNLRTAYGLPTPEHHEGVYAYYFYRLLQRARDVRMLYCSRADDRSTGEPSRYIYQLDFESGFPLRKLEVGVDVNLAPDAPIEIPKDAGVMRRLRCFLAGDPSEGDSHRSVRGTGDGKRAEATGTAFSEQSTHGSDAHENAPEITADKEASCAASNSAVAPVSYSNPAASASFRTLDIFAASDPGSLSAAASTSCSDPVADAVVSEQSDGGTHARAEYLPALSPTAFARYVTCPLKFYFYSVARIRPDEELTEEVDNPLFGTILHDAAQSLYERVKGERHPAETLRALAKAGVVERTVCEAIDRNCLHDPEATEADYTGNLLLVKDIVTKYLRGGVLRYDAAHDAFAVRGVEVDVAYGFPFEAAGEALILRFAGRADRIDSLDDGTLRVVDYKTGTPHLGYEGVEALFSGKGKQRLPNILQTMLYAMMLRHAEDRDVEPALYYVREMYREEYAPQPIDRTGGVGTRYGSFGEVFEHEVRRTLAELFDPSVPFRQCEDTDACRYCDFRDICRR